MGVIEYRIFCHGKLNKVKAKKIRKIGGCSWYLWEALGEWDFLSHLFIT
jgi:hypothetical protein